jgi:hypothetical protein
MKRRVCSYDMFAVPDPSFALKDTVGDVLLQFAMLLCLVGAVRYKAKPFSRR